MGLLSDFPMGNVLFTLGSHVTYLKDGAMGAMTRFTVRITSVPFR